MTIQFVENVFVDSYYPTIENTFTKPISHQGQEYAAEIIDTAGQVRFIEARSSGSYRLHDLKLASCLSIYLWLEGGLFLSVKVETKSTYHVESDVYPPFLEILGRVFNLQWKARTGYSWLHLGVLCYQQTKL